MSRSARKSQTLADEREKSEEAAQRRIQGRFAGKPLGTAKRSPERSVNIPIFGRLGNAMHVDHHDLQHEFPDMIDAIHVLKANNAYFSSLYASYDRLTGKVEDLEEHDMPVADFTLEDMKKQRLKLKDLLYHFLLAFRTGQQTRAG